MSAKNFKQLIMLIWLFSITFQVIGQEDKAEIKAKVSNKYWYIPNTAVGQFAGGIGMYSFGAGWDLNLGNGILQTDFLIGLVSRAYTHNKDLKIISLKVSYLPWKIQAKYLAIFPFRFGVLYSYTLGDDYYSFFNEPNKYQKHYYGWSTAGKFSFFLGSQINYKLKRNTLAIYYEMITNDKEIYLKYSNPKSVRWRDVFHLSLGVRYQFR